jgi:hypothetical protein
MAKKTLHKWEYGDFQTPEVLSAQAVKTLRKFMPDEIGTIIEPTCGTGSFLAAAGAEFRSAKKIIGMDINGDHLDATRARIKGKRYAKKVELLNEDFFQADWVTKLTNTPQPILVIGNPPWVTNADLGGLGSDNLPTKGNFQKSRGIEAITGKSNFDISESILVKFVEWLKGKTAYIAMLCKTAVARKVLRHIWKSGVATREARMYAIDAQQHFGAAVDACFLVIETLSAPVTDCSVFDTLLDEKPKTTFGYHDQLLVSNVPSYLTARQVLTGNNSDYIWRSGLKHDCSSIMELQKDGNLYTNGLGESTRLDAELLFPLLKSSDLGNGRTNLARKYVIVPQKLVGEDTSHIKHSAPNTWSYLTKHKHLFDRRGSSIYKNKPPFSIFGIGPYSFSDWKVAISGFYKELKFSVIGPIDGKPTMLDDTSYFLACHSQAEAEFIASLLHSDFAQNGLDSLVFWMEKRPITVDLLSRLNLLALAEAMNVENEYRQFSRGPKRQPEKPPKRVRRGSSTTKSPTLLLI